MKLVTRTFIRGLLALLPLLLTVYGVYHFFRWLNEWTNALLKLVYAGAPDVPGLGIVVGAGCIFALGLLVSARFTRRLYELVELPFNQIPIVRDLYAAIKQLTAFFGPVGERRGNQVVRVRHPDVPLELIGLMTRSDLDGLPDGIAREGRVAVYLPMSYQIGGYTLFVPRTWVEPLAISVEVAMRETLTGWLERPER
jgi:uncharacterized membrane protein